MKEEAKLILDYVLKVISSSATEARPCSHYYAKGIFPDGFYKELLANLPDNQDYEQHMHPDAVIDDKTSTRLRFDLDADHISKLDEKRKNFWNTYLPVLLSKELHLLTFKKLENDLVKRFNLPVEDIKVIPNVVLFRDFRGYNIRPHRDSARKAALIQFYLPQDDSHNNIGTILYDTNDGQNFNKVKKFSFSPNSVYSIPITDNSWHGVEKLSDEQFERNSLMIQFALDKKYHDLKR